MFGAPTKDDGGNFLAFAISNPQNTPKVEASFSDELAKTLKDGFTADEVAAAKKAWLQERGVGRSEDGALVGLLARPPAFRPHLEVRRDPWKPKWPRSLPSRSPPPSANTSTRPT